MPELISPGRQARIAWPRQLAIYFSRELTNTSLHDIGDAFGRRNHATVVHACKRVSDRLTTDPEVAAEVDALAQILKREHDDRSC